MVRALFDRQHLVISKLDSEDMTYKQKSSEQGSRQTFSPINVSTFDIQSFGAPHPEMGIIDRTLVHTKHVHFKAELRQIQI